MPESRVRASICVMAILAALISACVGDARTVVPRRDQPVIVRIGTFLPKLSSTPPSMVLAALFTSEPLVAAEWNGRPANRLAEAIAESDDGRLLTVSLKRNIRFHSGELLTAGRVRELILPKVPQDVRDVTVKDEHTLIFSLRQPYALKPADMSGLVVDTDGRPDLRTGPFKIVSIGPPLVLEPYREYEQTVPTTVARVEIGEFPSHRAAWSAMLRGEVNFLHEVNRDAIDFIQEGGQMKAYPLLRPFNITLVFNLRHALLGKHDVRVALNETIDRQEVVTNGMRGHGQIAEGPFWPHHWAYPDGRIQVPFNPEAARVRLDAAGFKVRPRGDEMPSRFAFTCLLPLGDSRFERLALVVQRQLMAIGVDMRLQPVPANELYRRAGTGDFEAVITEMSTGRTLRTPYNFWHSKGAIPISGYKSADAALDRMKLGRSDDEIRAAVLDVMRVLQSDPPAVFLAMPREVRAADISIEIPYEKDRDVFYRLRQARWRTPEGAVR